MRELKKILLWMLVVSMIVVFSIVGSLLGCKPAAEEEAVVEEEVAEEEVVVEEVVEKAPEEFVGEITIWHFNDEFDNFMIPIFSEIYPNITVNATKIPMGELIGKLESAFLTGVNVPDVFVGEQSWVKKMVQYDVWENISAAPYNAEEAAADQYDYCKDLARDADGNLVALSYQATPGGVFYRRSMAEEALGVSEPEDVGALMADMDAFLEMGRTLKDAGYFIVPGVQDIQRLFFFNKEQPWVVDGTLVIEDVVLDYLDVAKTIRDEGLDAKLDMWSGEWFAAMAGETVFSYAWPTWGLFFCLEPNMGETSGDWAVAHGPAAYAWGGTWLGISKDSPNKELAWEFVKTMTTNKDLLGSYADESGDVISDKVLAEEIAVGCSRESLGGQNHYAYFLEELDRLGVSGWAQRVSRYDEDIQGQFLTALMEYVNGTMTKDEAIQSFKDGVVSLYPEITVE